MPKNSPFLIDIGQGLSLRVGLPRIASWNSADRPKKPKMGTFGYNTTTSTLEYWDGTQWLGAVLS